MPKINKEELKKKTTAELQALFSSKARGYDAFENTNKGIRDLIDQLDEPEKVAVPQFVAEWIERQLPYGYENVFVAMKRVVDDGSYRLINWFDSNQDTFSRAWLDGYTVEEKKYRVKLIDGHTLGKYGDGEIAFVKGLNGANTTFTEQEINAIDPRYMAFAEEVQP